MGNSGQDDPTVTSVNSDVMVRVGQSAGAADHTRGAANEPQAHGEARDSNGVAAVCPSVKAATAVIAPDAMPLNPSESPPFGRKILIWGGGGKTALGKALAAKLGLPFVELDALHWLPDWHERPGEEFKQLVQETLDDLGGGWVVDGQYGGKLGSSVLERADTLMWLELPWRVVFWRTFKRTIRRARDKNLICGENVESWRLTFFSRHSILWWYIKLRLSGGYKRSIARREERVRESGGTATVIRLTSARQLDDFYAAHDLVRPSD